MGQRHLRGQIPQDVRRKPHSEETCSQTGGQNQEVGGCLYSIIIVLQSSVNIYLSFLQQIEKYL